MKADTGRWLTAWFHDWASWIKPVWFPAVIFFQELVVYIWAFGFQTDRSFLYIWLFSVSLGFFCDLFCALWGPTGCRLWSLLLTAVITLWFCVQTVYFTIFRTFAVLYSVGGAGQVLQFWRDILAGVRAAWLPLLLLLLFLTSIAFFFVGTAAVDSATQGVLSPRYLYREDFIPQLAVGRFGVMTTLRLDARQLLLARGIQALGPDKPTEPTAAEVQETTPLTTPEPTPAPVVYG